MMLRTFNLLFLNRLKCNSASTLRFYSIYTPNYIKPIFRKEDQEALFKTNKVKELAHVPIKPATNFDTSSEFYDTLVRKFINRLMKKGNRTMARKLVDGAFENIKIIQLREYYKSPPEKREHIILDPKVLFYKAIENSTPILELYKVIKGGITYHVPVPVHEKRAEFISMKWLIETAMDKGNTDKFVEVLATEIINAANKEGRVIKKKLDLYKQCEANRAYAHYRWL